MKPAYTDAVIRRFERAVENYAFRGTIPQYESDEANKAYNKVCAEYRRAKQALYTMVDRLNSQPQRKRNFKNDRD